MTINIQDLLKELLPHTVIETSNISANAKNILGEMRDEFDRLEASCDPNKQTKMIELFMGGTIRALRQDDNKYRYSSELYPTTLAKDVFKTIQSPDTLTESIYKVGQQALLNLPNTFNGNIFKHQEMLINSQKPIPFFPGLKENADKVDLLVKFCIKYADNLNKAEAENLELVDLQASDKINISDEPVKSNQPLANQSQASAAPLSNINMQILGGFITAIGVAAVATAFAALNAATFGVAGLVVVGFGAAAILGGIGLFGVGTYKQCKSSPDISIDNSLAPSSL